MCAAWKENDVREFLREKSSSFPMSSVRITGHESYISLVVLLHLSKFLQGFSHDVLAVVVRACDVNSGAQCKVLRAVLIPNSDKKTCI